MDQSLWILTKLRLLAVYRRWRRSLSRPRGILITVVFSLSMFPSFLMALVIPFFKLPVIFTEPVERFGPVGLLVLTIVSLISSSGEAALYFSPAEVDFLFAGPYHRRQLVGFKLVIISLIGLVSALFFGAMASASSPHFSSAFVGSLLIILFFQFSQMALGLGLNLAGSVAWSRGRSWALLGLLVVLIAVVLPSRESLVVRDWKAFGLAVEQSPITFWVLTPFRWFIHTYTARDWSSLLLWGGPALALDLALVALVYGLDAGYLEASLVASARQFAKVQKLTKGGGGTIKLSGRSTGRFRLRPPRPLWLGGVGPNLWRQMITALGSPAQLVLLILAIGGASWIFASFLTLDQTLSEKLSSALLPISLSIAMPLTILLSLLMAYDFRGDLDVMETLKTMPISPLRLAVGQILTPVILSTVLQAVGCLGVALGARCSGDGWFLIGSILAFLFPANLFFYAVENLLFLWYPSRVVAGQFNGGAVVRQMMLLLAKGLAVGVAVGLVVAVGFVGYFAVGRQVGLALVLAWLTLGGLALALMPLLARAFDAFDVTSDVPA